MIMVTEQMLLDKITQLMNELAARVCRLEELCIDMHPDLTREMYEKQVNDIKSVLVHKQDQDRAKHSEDWEKCMKRNFPKLYEEWKKFKSGEDDD